MDDGDNNPWTWLEYRTNPLARIFLAVTLPLMLIAFGTLLIRTVPRLRAATRLAVDDWFAVAGFVGDSSSKQTEFITAHRGNILGTFFSLLDCRPNSHIPPSRLQ